MRPSHTPPPLHPSHPFLNTPLLTPAPHARPKRPPLRPRSSAARPSHAQDVEPRQRGESLQRGEPLSLNKPELANGKRAYSHAVHGIGKPQTVNSLDGELSALVRALHGDKGLGKRVDGPLDLLDLEQASRYSPLRHDLEQASRYSPLRLDLEQASRYSPLRHLAVTPRYVT